MAATVKQNLWPYQGDGQAAPRPVRRQIAASQGLLIIGTPMFRNTDGYVEKAVTSAATNATVHYVLAETIGTEKSAADDVWVYELSTSQRWCVFVENGGSDAAATQTLVGDEFGMTVSGTAGSVGYTTLDTNKTTNTCFHVHDIYPNVCPSDPSYGTTSSSPGIAIVAVRSGNITATT